jgi:hypothetical protein
MSDIVALRLASREAVATVSTELSPEVPIWAMTRGKRPRNLYLLRAELVDIMTSPKL